MALKFYRSFSFEYVSGSESFNKKKRNIQNVEPWHGHLQANFGGTMRV